MAQIRARSEAFVPPFTRLAKRGEIEPTLIVSGKGIRLRDEAGRELIDGWAGMTCVSLGYGREELVEVCASQLRNLSYAHSLYDYTHELPTKTAERLVEITPASLQHVFLTMSGSDAGDTLLKILRYYHNLIEEPQKKHVIAMEHAYHGASSLMAGLTHFPECHRFFDLPFDFEHHIPSPFDLGVHSGVSGDEVIERSVAALERKVAEIGADRVAAFVCEPVMITAGVIVPPLGWLGAMEETCRRLGILLMVDEVVTGFARTGRMFACEWDGVEPDMMFLGKAITSGYIPMGAALFSSRIYRAMTERVPADLTFGHGFTHSGHPPSCAVTLECISHYEKLVPHSEELGAYLLQGLETLADEHPWVGNVRGRGLCAGFDVLADSATGERFAPERQIGPRIRRRAHEAGLIVRSFDLDMFGFSPPLIITREEIDEMLGLLREAIDSVRAEEQGAA